MSAAERIIELATDLPVGDRLRLVVDASGKDAVTKRERIERDFAGGALPLDLPGQVPGYWFASYEEIPATMPEWSPNGAVLPRAPGPFGDEAIRLDLVPIDYVWFPLSYAGTYTYAHSAGLRRGEVWSFVPATSADAPWPTVYVAELAAPISAADVESLYGAEAARRTRADEQSVQVRLVRQPTRA